MAWTAPRTWVANEEVSADNMNTHVRDNLDWLKARPSAVSQLDLVADISTSSTSFADIDATNLSVSVTTSGGSSRVFVMFIGSVIKSTNGIVYFDIMVDGAAHAGNDGITHQYVNTGALPQIVAVTAWLTGLSAAAHTIKMRWMVDAGSATLYAGAATASHDMHPEFFAVEL